MCRAISCLSEVIKDSKMKEKGMKIQKKMKEKLYRLSKLWSRTQIRELKTIIFIWEKGEQVRLIIIAEQVDKKMSVQEKITCKCTFKTKLLFSQ